MKNKPQYKICRRLGAPIYEKCQTQKFVQSEGRKARSSGKRAKAPSDYGAQLLEKQKVRFTYGISERQLSNYVKEATQVKGMPVVEKLYELLESRLDNVAYRLGFGNTRRFTRQMVSHGHLTVNGKKITVPSYQVRPGDVVAVRDGSRTSAMFTDFEKKVQSYTWPSWLTLEPAQLKATVKEKAKHDDQFLKLDTVLEFYSR